MEGCDVDPYEVQRTNVVELPISRRRVPQEKSHPEDSSFTLLVRVSWTPREHRKYTEFNKKKKMSDTLARRKRNILWNKWNGSKDDAGRLAFESVLRDAAMKYTKTEALDLHADSEISWNVPDIKRTLTFAASTHDIGCNFGPNGTNIGVVTGIRPESASAKRGVQPMWAVLAINEKSATKHSEISQQLREVSSGKDETFTVTFQASPKPLLMDTRFWPSIRSEVVRADDEDDEKDGDSADESTPSSAFDSVETYRIASVVGGGASSQDEDDDDDDEDLTKDVDKGSCLVTTRMPLNAHPTKRRVHAWTVRVVNDVAEADLRIGVAYAKCVDFDRHLGADVHGWSMSAKTGHVHHNGLALTQVSLRPMPRGSSVSVILDIRPAKGTVTLSFDCWDFASKGKHSFVKAYDGGFQGKERALYPAISFGAPGQRVCVTRAHHSPVLGGDEFGA